MQRQPIDEPRTPFDRGTLAVPIGRMRRFLGTVLQKIGLGEITVAIAGRIICVSCFPDNLGWAIGDTVVCTSSPGGTQYWAKYNVVATTGNQELWFSPGGSSGATERSELWVLSSDPTTPDPVYVWTCGTDFEYITHICWSKVDDELYVFTYQEDAIPNPIVTVYRVNRVARTVAQVVQFAGLATDWVTPGSATADVVIDSAQFNNQIWVAMGGRLSPGGIFAVFDPIAETFVHNYTVVTEDGWGGGMATDSGNTRLFGSDGHSVYEYSGGVWVLDADLSALFGSYDSVAMLTDWENDLIYHGQMLQGVANPLVVVRNGGWNASLANPGTNRNGMSALSNLYNEATGALIATYAIGWGAGGDPDGQLYRQDVGGAWVLDGTVGTDCEGLATQGLAQLAGKVYILARDISDRYARLYRRDGVGSYTEVWNSGGQAYFRDATFGYAAGMALAPSPTALAPELALMRRCHEVN